LQGCGFAFKFFLPQGLHEPMQQRLVGRFDRIPTYIISWSANDLVEMLSMRLSSLSYDEADAVSHVTCFRDLCDVDFNVDMWLAQAAGSPRDMVRLAGKILERHCERYTTTEELISAETVKSILEEHTTAQQPSVLHTEASQPSTSAGMPARHEDEEISVFPDEAGEQAPETAGELADGPPKLFFDAWGDLWLDDRRLDETPEGKSYTIIQYLWQNRNRVVSYEELFIALWGKDEQAWPASPKNSCNKHVQALRKLIEPGHSDSNTYIAVKRGIGYVLRNIHED
jgi:hypothetical protein